MIPTWLPVKLIASTPMSASAMHSSAIDTRSPVVSSMSSSRPGCVDDTELASAIRLSVALPIADTTTTTSLPCRLVNATFSATAFMRSGSATDVPPYFWTISATRRRCYEPARADTHAVPRKVEPFQPSSPSVHVVSDTT